MTTMHNTHRSRHILTGFCIVLAGLLVGCPELPGTDDPMSGNASVAVPGDAVVVRVKVTPASFLLTGAGETTTLTAEALNAAGEVVPAEITWKSSGPDVIDVSAEGQVTAVADLGSAQITAEAAGLSSPIVMGVIAKPAAGAKLVSDEQVISEPTPVDPEAEYGLGYRYRVTLTGAAAPEVGGIVVGTGEKLVAGRVVDTAQDGDAFIVTLEVVGLDELFEDLRFEQSFDLSQGEFEVPAEIAAGFDVSVRSDGTIDYTPRSGANAKASGRAMAVGPQALFNCESDVDFPIQFNVPPVVSLTRNITVDISFDLLAGGLQRFVVTGEAKTTWNLSPSLAVNFAGSYKCETTLLILPLPVLPPWMKLILYPEIPLGLGVEASGSLTAAQIGFELSGETKYTLALGADRQSGEWEMVNTAEIERKPSVFKPVLPNPDHLTEQFKIAIGLQAYAWAEVQIANPFIKSLKFDAFKARFGPKFSLDMEDPTKQAKSASSSSGYKLSLAGEAGIGSGIDKFMRMLKISFVELKVELDIPLAASPKGTFTVTPQEAIAGDERNDPEPVRFDVVLDANTFLGFFQPVDAVEIWVKDEDGRFVRADELCERLPADAGQTIFSCESEFVAPDDVGEWELYAFYLPSLFGVPLVPFEVADNSKVIVEVKEQKAAEFEGLGFLPGGRYSEAVGVSADGSVVVGYSVNADGKTEAFRWSGGTMIGLGFLPGGDLSQAHGVSADGSVVVGWSRGPDEPEAFRWLDGTMTGLGIPPGWRDTGAFGVSADGSVVVGFGSNPPHNNEAFRWSGGAITGLGFLPGGHSSTASGVSADGSVVVGHGQHADRFTEAVRWSGGAMTGLGFLPGGRYSEAVGVSADGSVVVGYGQNADGFTEAFRWSGGAMTGLGFLPGGNHSRAYGVSADGSVVVGYGEYEAFIWDADHGMRSLKTELTDQYGLTGDIENWRLIFPRGISADGRTIVGRGTNPDGHSQAWRAYLGTRRP